MDKEKARKICKEIIEDAKNDFVSIDGDYIDYSISLSEEEIKAINFILKEIEKLDTLRDKLEKDIDKNKFKFDIPYEDQTIEVVEKGEYAQEILEVIK